MIKKRVLCQCLFMALYVRCNQHRFWIPVHIAFMAHLSIDTYNMDNFVNQMTPTFSPSISIVL